MEIDKGLGINRAEYQRMSGLSPQEIDLVLTEIIFFTFATSFNRTKEPYKIRNEYYRAIEKISREYFDCSCDGISSSNVEVTKMSSGLYDLHIALDKLSKKIDKSSSAYSDDTSTQVSGLEIDLFYLALEGKNPKKVCDARREHYRTVVRIYYKYLDLVNPKVKDKLSLGLDALSKSLQEGMNELENKIMSQRK